MRYRIYLRFAFAFMIAVSGIIFTTTLLTKNHIGEAIFLVIVVVFVIAGFAIFLHPRLKELDLKNLRIVLRELKQIKSEIEEMYGGIEHLKKEPLVLDESKIAELGLDGHDNPATAGAVMRYASGCIKRERERLAKVLVKEKTPETIAKGILDNRLDDNVFKWVGPDVELDVDS